MAHLIIIGLNLVTSFPRGKERAYLSVSLGWVITFPRGEALACLTNWETELDLVQFTALAMVIFPSFLVIRWLHLFNCLCLTLMNLISLTLFMKPWHSASLSAEMIEASLVLHSLVCLATWSKMLLMALPFSLSIT